MPSAQLSTVAALVSLLAPVHGGRLFTKRSFFISAPFVGNHGFDPLKVAAGANLVPMRHAEVKHGRLAMVCAVAWPLQELLHPFFVETINSLGQMNVRNVLEATSGYTPTVLNGGLNVPEAAPALALAVVVGAWVEMQEMNGRMQQGFSYNEFSPESVAGDYGFDPLRLSTDLGVTDRYELQEAEMINGRWAMLAVMAYLIIELGLGTRVVDFIGTRVVDFIQ